MLRDVKGALKYSNTNIHNKHALKYQNMPSMISWRRLCDALHLLPPTHTCFRLGQGQVQSRNYGRYLFEINYSPMFVTYVFMDLLTLNIIES